MKLLLQNDVFGKGLLAILAVMGGFCLSACGAGGGYPSLADIPSAPASVTPMDERRAIAEEIAKDAEPEPEETLESIEEGEEAAQTSAD